MLIDLESLKEVGGGLIFLLIIGFIMVKGLQANSSLHNKKKDGSTKSSTSNESSSTDNK